jgi:hypothetical protein
MTASEKQAIAEYEQRQSLLEPFRRITAGWGVETQHKFQKRIRDLDLVASGDLESEWHVDVIARDTGVIVAQFGFNEDGRYHDMRRVDKSADIHGDAFESWITSKVKQGQIRYSRLAEKLGVAFSDPRVIHDLKWRMARSDTFNTKKRRRWYNKGKEASVNDLYDELQETIMAITLNGFKSAPRVTSVS